MSAYSVSRIRRSLIYFSMGKGLGMILGFGLLLILVRALGLEAYNFYLISQALLFVIDSLSSFGLGAAAQRYLPEMLSLSEGRKLSKLTGILCALRAITLLVVVILLYIFAEFLAAIINLNELVEPLRYFLIVIFFELFARYLSIVFDSLLLQGYSQISMLLRVGIRVVSVSWLYFASEGNVTLETWIMIDIVAAMIGCAWGGVSLWLFMRKTAIATPGTVQSLDIRRYFRYALPYYMADNISTLSNQNVIRLVAAQLLQANQFASFGFSASFVTMLQRYLPMFLLINMIRPLFVAARQRSDYIKRIPTLATMVIKLNMFTLVPLLVFVAIYSESIANILTGGRYPEAGSYLIAFLPLLITKTLRDIVNIISQAMENARAPLVATVLSLLGLLFGILLSNSIGAYGLCIGLVLTDVIFSVWVLNVLMANKLIFDFDWKGYSKLLALALISICILLGINNITSTESPISIVSHAIIIAGLYLFLAYIIKPFTQEERYILNKLFKVKLFVW